jgi:hypothetical protein
MKLDDINIIIGQQQIESLDLLINILKNKNKEDKIEAMKKTNIQKSVAWCEKYKIPCNKFSEKTNIFLPINKEYKNRSGLWKHAQQCEASVKSEISPQNESQVSPANTMVSNEMIMCLIQQNKELQTTLIELAKEARTVNNTSNTTNNQFNLNVFLNEECKHALNIQEFIDSIKVTLEDFMETGRLGYMQGITRILVDAVHKLDVKLRPFHCTDIKRETLYIKDKDTWEKANAEKTKLRNAITQVARKNLSMLSVWQAQNPDFVKINTPECEEFIRLSLGVVGSQYLEEQYKTEDRIVKNILREIVIDKKVSHIDNA